MQANGLNRRWKGLVVGIGTEDEWMVRDLGMRAFEAGARAEYMWALSVYTKTPVMEDTTRFSTLGWFIRTIPAKRGNVRGWKSAGQQKGLWTMGSRQMNFSLFETVRSGQGKRTGLRTEDKKLYFLHLRALDTPPHYPQTIFYVP